jgi:hypothetical protein
MVKIFQQFLKMGAWAAVYTPSPGRLTSPDRQCDPLREESTNGDCIPTPSAKSTTFYCQSCQQCAAPRRASLARAVIDHTSNNCVSVLAVCSEMTAVSAQACSRYDLLCGIERVPDHIRLHQNPLLATAAYPSQSAAGDSPSWPKAIRCSVGPTTQ